MADFNRAEALPVRVVKYAMNPPTEPLLENSSLDGGPWINPTTTDINIRKCACCGVIIPSAWDVWTSDLEEKKL